MSDTLAPEPPPKTIGDSLPPAAPQRKGTWFLVMVGLIVAFMGAAGFAAWTVLRHDPVALGHTPGDANVVLYINLQRAVASPAADAALTSAEKSEAFAKLDNELHEGAGLNITRDVREIGISSVDGTGWVVAFGGKIPSGIVPKLLPILQARSPSPTWRLDAGRIHGPVAIGQAQDKTLILTTRPELLDAALAGSDRASVLGVTNVGAPIQFGLGPSVWSRAPAVLRTALDRAARVRGQISLSDTAQGVLWLDAGGEQDPNALLIQVERGMTALRLLSLTIDDRFGVIDALRKSHVSLEGRSVRITLELSAEALEKMTTALPLAMPQASPN